MSTPACLLICFHLILQWISVRTKGGVCDLGGDTGGHKAFIVSIIVNNSCVLLATLLHKFRSWQQIDSLMLYVQQTGVS